MDKEQLVFEMFKERLTKEYISRAHTGIGFNTSTVLWDIKEYCKKIGADFSKLEPLLDNHRKMLFTREKSKRLEHIIDFKTAKYRPTSLQRKVKSRIADRERNQINKFVEENKKRGGVGG